jgi:hypothetical protein
MLDKLLKMDTALLTIKTQITKYKALFKADGTIDVAEQAFLDALEADAIRVDEKLVKVIRKFEAEKNNDTLNSEYDKDITQEEAEALFYPLLEKWKSEDEIFAFLSTCLWDATETPLVSTENMNIADWAEHILKKLYEEGVSQIITASKGFKKYKAELLSIEMYMVLDTNATQDEYPRDASPAVGAFLLRFPKEKSLNTKIQDINSGKEFIFDLSFRFQVIPSKKK